MRIREYFLSVSQQLEEFNNMLQTQLETAHAEISTKAAEISQLREQGRAQTAEAKQLAEQKLRLEKKTQALEGQVEHFRPKATAIVDTFPGVDIRPLQEIISSSSSLSDALTDALDFGFLSRMYARRVSPLPFKLCRISHLRESAMTRYLRRGCGGLDRRLHLRARGTRPSAFEAVEGSSGRAMAIGASQPRVSPGCMIVTA